MFAGVISGVLVGVGGVVFVVVFLGPFLGLGFVVVRAVTVAAFIAVDDIDGADFGGHLFTGPRIVNISPVVDISPQSPHVDGRLATITCTMREQAA
jgi:hypothetical protein